MIYQLFKKFLLCLLILFFCGDLGLSQDEQKVLVVYYSRDGHTKLVAEKLAEKFNSDIERLIDKKKRTGPIGNVTAGKDAVTQNLTKIEPLILDPSEYDVILIGTPSWFSNMTPAVRTFITEHDISDKKIGVFATTHLTGVETCLDRMVEFISSNESDTIPKLPLRHRDLEEEVLIDKIDAFYKEVINLAVPIKDLSSSTSD